MGLPTNPKRLTGCKRQIAASGSSVAWSPQSSSGAGGGGAVVAAANTPNPHSAAASPSQFSEATIQTSAAAAGQNASQFRVQPVAYFCQQCQADVYISPKDAIRCRDCGYRILFKKRTYRYIVFSAR